MTSTNLPVVRSGEPGRPEYSDAVWRKLLRGLSAGMTRQAAAGFSGMHRSTLYERIERDPDFRAEVEKAEDVAEARYTATISHVGIVSRDANAAMKWLERRRPASWREQVKVIEEAGSLATDMTESDVDDLRTLLAESQRRRAAGEDREPEDAGSGGVSEA